LVRPSALNGSAPAAAVKAEAGVAGRAAAELGLLIAGMVSLGLAIGLLLKTLIRAGDDAVTLKLTAATQRARLTAQTRGLAEVQRLRQFIEVHNEIRRPAPPCGRPGCADSGSPLPPPSPTA
jgi:hypothetical protein